MVRNITELFFSAAEKHPDNIAIIDKERQVTYRELAESVRQTAGHFRMKGVREGDRVLIFVPMSIDLYRIVLAIFYMNATAVFLDEWVNIKRMEACCRIAGCKAFVGNWKVRALGFLLSKEIRRIPIKLGTSYPSSGTIPGLAEAGKENADSTALITFTTGSTGMPKAAKRTHFFLHEQFCALIEKIDPKESDVDMPVLPIVLLLNLGTGATSVIADFKASKPHTLEPAKIIEQVNRHKVNRLTSSPFFIKEVSKHIIKNRIDTSRFTKLFTGGAPVFPNEAELYSKAFPGAKFEVVYGSTEAEPISSINVSELVKEKENVLSKGLKVGSIYHRAEVKIIPISDEALTFNSQDELNNIALKPYQPGEIIVSGHHVLREYISNPEALKRNKIFIGDKVWHRTGDAGYLDESNVLYLAGRCNMMIPASCGYLSPFLFENFFQAIDGVETGTIMKINERLVAVIELNDHHRKESTERAVAQAPVEFDEIIYIKKIPRDPRHNSKIDYSRLQQALQG